MHDVKKIAANVVGSKKAGYKPELASGLANWIVDGLSPEDLREFALIRIEDQYRDDEMAFDEDLEMFLEEGGNVEELKRG